MKKYIKPTGVGLAIMIVFFLFRFVACDSKPDYAAGESPREKSGEVQFLALGTTTFNVVPRVITPKTSGSTLTLRLAGAPLWRKRPAIDNGPMSFSPSEIIQFRMDDVVYQLNLSGTTKFKVTGPVEFYVDISFTDKLSEFYTGERDGVHFEPEPLVIEYVESSDSSDSAYAPVVVGVKSDRDGSDFLSLPSADQVVDAIKNDQKVVAAIIEVAKPDADAISKAYQKSKVRAKKYWGSDADGQKVGEVVDSLDQTAKSVESAITKTIQATPSVIKKWWNGVKTKEL